MDNILLNTFNILSLVGGVMVVSLLVQLCKRFGLRPLVGLLLRRKQKIRPDSDTVGLFRVGNHDVPVTSMRELYESRDRLQAYIDKSSWFREQESAALQRHFEMMHQALTQVLRDRDRAASAGAAAPVAEWRKVLGVEPHCRDPKVIKSHYRRLVSAEHPDKGGTGKRMPEFNRALDTARRELNFV